MPALNQGFKRLSYHETITGMCILYTVGISIYLVCRAFYVPPFSDEVTTFFFYIQPGKFQPFYSHLDANNHVLNSLFARISYVLFGDHIFFLRLPTLLSFFLFVFFGFKMRRFFNSKYVWALCYITLISSPYFLDFFHLCRGYGMSMSFLLGGIYFIPAYPDNRKSSHIILGYLFSSLALWSNLSLMITSISIGTLLTWLLIKHVLKDFKSLKLIIGILSFLFLFLAPHIYAVLFSFELRNSGKFYLGQNGLFVYTTVASLAHEFFNPFTISWMFFWMLFLFQVIIIVYILRKRKGTFTFWLVQFLLAGTVAGTILLHHLMGINYTVERAAVHFFLLWVISFFFTIDTFGKKFVNFIAAIPVLFFVFQLIYVANFRYLQHWQYEAIPSKYHDYLSNWANTQKKVPTISSPELQGTVFAWHDYQSKEKLNSAQHTNFPDTLADFIIGSHEMKGICPPGYDTLFFDNGSKVSLLERTVPVPWKLDTTYTIKEELSGPEFVPIIRIDATRYADRPVLSEIVLTAQ